MKKSFEKVIDQLAEYFDQELSKVLSILILPDNSLVYKNFLVKQLTNKNWGIFNIRNGDLIEQYYFKSCAIVAAKMYFQLNFNKFNEVKNLDYRCWSNYFDGMLLKNMIKTTKDYNNYLVLVSKIEYSDSCVEHYKDKITSVFKQAFLVK